MVHPPGKLRWLAGKSTIWMSRCNVFPDGNYPRWKPSHDRMENPPIFNTKYIDSFIGGFPMPVMLVNSGGGGVGDLWIFHLSHVIVLKPRYEDHQGAFFLGRFRAIRGWPFFGDTCLWGILFGDFLGKDRGVGLWKQTGGMRDLYVSCWVFSKDCMFFWIDLFAWVIFLQRFF